MLSQLISVICDVCCGDEVVYICLLCKILISFLGNGSEASSSSHPVVSINILH